MRLECMVPIKPVPKARARVTSNGTYTPAATRQAEKDIRTYWTQKHLGGFGDDAELRLVVTVALYRPKTVTRMHPIGRPDWDNFGKTVSDALNGIAYRDDSQVVDGRVIKRYCLPGEAPHIEIMLEEMEQSGG